MKTLDEQIAELEKSANGLIKSAADYRQTAENLAREATEALSRAAELKAKRTAEVLRAKRDAEASKTVGQRVAEKMIRSDGHVVSVGYADESPSYWPIYTDHTDACERSIREKVATAIDQAVADEREACAKLALDAPVYRSVTTQQQIADAIRGRAK